MAAIAVVDVITYAMDAMPSSLYVTDAACLNMLIDADTDADNILILAAICHAISLAGC